MIRVCFSSAETPWPGAACRRQQGEDGRTDGQGGEDHQGELVDLQGRHAGAVPRAKAIGPSVQSAAAAIARLQNSGAGIGFLPSRAVDGV